MVNYARLIYSAQLKVLKYIEIKIPTVGDQKAIKAIVYMQCRVWVAGKNFIIRNQSCCLIRSAKVMRAF